MLITEISSFTTYIDCLLIIKTHGSRIGGSKKEGKYRNSIFLSYICCNRGQKFVDEELLIAACYRSLLIVSVDSARKRSSMVFRAGTQKWLFSAIPARGAATLAPGR